MEQAKPGQYLTFNLRGRPFGVPIGTVREINRMGDITPVPKTPTFMAGVMNLRGKVIPVVDLRTKFGVETAPYTRETCIIVIEGTTGQIGTIVDSVSDVVELKDGQIEPTPTITDDPETRYIMGIGKHENRVILLVDIVHALAQDHLLAQNASPEKAAS